MKKIFLYFCMIFTLFSCSEKHNNISETTTQQTQIEQKIYIDVRTDEEWNAGHIENAIHIPLSDIQAGKNIEKIPHDTPVHVYCRSGNRSGQAIKILEQKGFPHLINAGGMSNIEGVKIVK